jgi:hypothetical protein
MPIPCKQASDYFTGSPTIVLIGDTLLTRTAPNQADITLTTATPAVSIGGTSITLSAALTKAIRGGERLKFGSSVVQVDDDVAVGATTIPILPALSAISIGATCVKQAWLRYESPASVDLNFSADAVEMRNMQPCDWKSQLLTKRSVDISIDGNVIAIASDLGRAMIRQAVMSTDRRIMIGILEPDGSWFRARCWASALNRKMAVDTPFTQSVTLQVDGEPIYGSATDLVLA